MGTSKTVVLDTAALLAGLGPGQAFAPDVQWLTTPSVAAEVRPGGPTGRAAERALAAGLVVKPPEAEARERVREAARASGDLSQLSGTDLDVLALALESAPRGPVELWSDDFAVQNVAARFGITSVPVVGPGIRSIEQWYVRCTGCGRYAPDGAPGGECTVCGHALKRTRRPPGRVRRG